MAAAAPPVAACAVVVVVFSDGRGYLVQRSPLQRQFFYLNEQMMILSQ